MAIIPIDQLPDSEAPKSVRPTPRKNLQSKLSSVIPIDQLPDEEPSSFFTEANIQVPLSEESALTPFERFKFSLGDSKGQEDFLKQKFRYVIKNQDDGTFMVGNDPRALQPVDPKGFFGDSAGELAEIASMIPSIAGSITGGASGFTLGGVPGAFAGASVGAALGRGIEQTAGRAFGTYKATPEEQATDMAITGAFGATGEGLGQLLKIGGPIALKNAMKLIPKVIQEGRTPGEQTFTRKAMVNFWNATSGIDKKLINSFFDNSDEVLKKGASSDDALRGIINDFSKTFKEYTQSTSKNLASSEREVIENMKYSFPTTDLQKNMLYYMKKYGVINEFNERVLNTTNSADFKKLDQIFKQLGGERIGKIQSPIFNQFGKAIGKESADVLSITDNPRNLNDLINIRRESLNQAEIAQRFGKGQLSNIYKTIVKGDPEGSFFGKPTQGIDDYIEKLVGGMEKSKNTKISDAAKTFLNAKRASAEFLDIKDKLSQAGLKLDNPSSIEGLTLRSNDALITLKDQLARFDKFTNTPFSKRMEIYDTAKALDGTNPNILRFNTIASLLGLGAAFGGRTPEEKIGGIGAAIMLGTPFGLKTLTKGYNLQKQTIGNLLKFKKPVKSEQLNRALIQIISRQQKEKLTQQNSGDHELGWNKQEKRRQASK